MKEGIQLSYATKEKLKIGKTDTKINFPSCLFSAIYLFN